MTAREALAGPLRIPARGAFAALALLAARPAIAAVQVPTNFIDQVVVGGLDQPTSFAFLPGGRLLFTEQNTAKIRMVVNGHIAATDPILVVPQVEPGGERGLLGIAVDPAWPTLPFVYVMYSRTNGTTRVVRYLASDDVDVPNGENLSLSAPRVLLDDIPDQFGNHNGGCLRFGPDGCLYVSIGDDAVFCDAADSTSLRGEILRLRVGALPIYGGPAPRRSVLTPPDNPFVASPDSNARLVYAFGLRNPFRFHIDPTLGTLYVADVGEDTQEEVDEVAAGDFLGWPWLEGGSPRVRPECPEPGGVGARPSRAPIVTMPHDDPVAYAIIAAGMYRPVLGGSNNWPPAYYPIRGDVFYAQYYSGTLQRITWNGTAWNPAAPVPGQPTTTAWATGLTTPADFLVGPDGSLWWLAQYNATFAPTSGSLHRIRYVGAPTAVASAEVRTLALGVSPNPSSASLELSFSLAAPERVRLDLYDLGGRRVRLLLEGAAPAGETRLRWDGRDELGGPLDAGVYFARLTREGAAPMIARVLRVR